jgi:hypothetical protein
MNTRVLFSALLALALVSATTLALNPDDELWIPAAARGAGNEGSFWMTDLYVMNLGSEEVTIEITWLDRDADNSEAEPFEYAIAAGETLVLEDVISQVFGQQEAAGAIWIEVKDEDDGDEGEKDDEGEEEEDETNLIATARIYNLDDDETFGQGFEGIISDAAISADGQATTHVIGITDNASFRTNWYGLNITEDEEDEPDEAQVMIEVLDLAGNVLATDTFDLPPLAPVLKPVSALGAGTLDNGALRFTMVEGAGIFGAAKIDDKSNDPTTLEAHWQCAGEAEGAAEFTVEFFIDDCTFATTGSNPLFPLEPGFQQVLEGEEDGEVIMARATVLDETYVVDGVECRVFEEYETVDGELEEISRNYMAYCVETGSVFYFGEHVDIYEDGAVVSHDGEWLAGENGAEPGIIMPGTILLGSRYQQETAPGVAMDRGEVVAMDLTVETEAGTFTDCVQINDSSPLDPGAEDIKVYCPGIGNVIDEDLELVEFTDPSAP